MLLQVLLTAFLCSQLVVGHIVLQGNPQSAVPEPLASERWSYEVCGTADDLIDLKEIALKPDPPKLGEDLEVTIKGYVKETLAEGTFAYVTVKLGAIKVFQNVYDVCEEARSINSTVQCPVEKGDHTAVLTAVLPRNVPRAKFLIEIRVHDQEDRKALCVNFMVDFTPHRGSMRLW